MCQTDRKVGTVKISPPILPAVSPVLNQPSSVNDSAVVVGLFQYLPIVQGHTAFANTDQTSQFLTQERQMGLSHAGRHH